MPAKNQKTEQWKRFASYNRICRSETPIARTIGTKSTALSVMHRPRESVLSVSGAAPIGNRQSEFSQRPDP
jgi:hypothetical protein